MMEMEVWDEDAVMTHTLKTHPPWMAHHQSLPATIGVDDLQRTHNLAAWRHH
jgi:hypothetical protein